MKKTISIVIYTCVLVLVTAIVTCSATMLALSVRRLQQGETVSITKEEYALLEQYKKLEVLSNALDENYYLDVDGQSLMDGAAYGMVDSLGDPYSTYLTSEDMDALMEEDKGEYVGIGGTFLMDPQTGAMVITRIYPGSPLSMTDAQVGDQLYAVDGEPVIGLDQTTVATRIRGEENTSVQITLLRGSEQHVYTLTRKLVEVIDVDYRMVENDTLLITLSSFSTHADKAFKEAVEYGKKQKMKALIIDLRNNGGGDSGVLQSIADILLPEGVIFYTETKQGDRTTFRSDAKYLGVETVVLCDGNSASASEVLIAALQDYDAATIIGTETFGKAIGQSTMQLNEDGSGVYLTTVRVYSPKGRNWHGEGLDPDLVVELPDDLVSNPLLRTDENDLQLQEALRVIREKLSGESAAA